MEGSNHPPGGRVSRNSELFGPIYLDNELLMKPVFDFTRTVDQIRRLLGYPIPEKFCVDVLRLDCHIDVACQRFIDNFTEADIPQYRSRPKNPTPVTAILNCLSNVLTFSVLDAAMDLPFCDFFHELHQLPRENSASFAEIMSTICQIIGKVQSPQKFLLTISNALLPRGYFEPHSRKSEFISIISNVSFSSGLFSKAAHCWAILTPSKEFALYNADGHTQIELFTSSEISSSSKGEIKVKDSKSSKKVTFKCDVPELCEMWERSAQLKLWYIECIPHLKPGVYPDTFLNAIRVALFMPDMIFLESILNYQFVKVSDCQPLLEAVLTIAIHENRVDRFLSFITFSEIANSPSNDVILRANSLCTRLFKVYSGRFMTDYISKYVSQIVGVIMGLKCEDLTDPKTNVDEFGGSLFSAFDVMFESQGSLPGPFKHLALHVAQAAICCGQNRKAVLNALSSLYVLRFLVPLITEPEWTGLGSVSSAKVRKVLAPFGQIFHDSISMIGIKGDRYAHFFSLNPKLEQLCPKFFDFLVSLPLKSSENPNYPSVSDSDMDSALRVVVDHIAEKSSLFYERFQEISINIDRIHPLSYRLLNYICSSFQKLGDF